MPYRLLIPAYSIVYTKGAGQSSVRRSGGVGAGGGAGACRRNLNGEAMKPQTCELLTLTARISLLIPLPSFPPWLVPSFDKQRNNLGSKAPGGRLTVETLQQQHNWNHQHTLTGLCWAVQHVHELRRCITLQDRQLGNTTRRCTAICFDGAFIIVSTTLRPLTTYDVANVMAMGLTAR